MDGKAIIVLVMALVSGIIGLSIIDSITADSITPAIINETIGTANGTGYILGTLTYTPLVTPVVYADGVIQTENITVIEGSRELITEKDSNNFIDAEVKAYYTYDDATFLSGSLSRTIIKYVVPLGLLGILGLAALGFSS